MADLVPAVAQRDEGIAVLIEARVHGDPEGQCELAIDVEVAIEIRLEQADVPEDGDAALDAGAQESQRERGLRLPVAEFRAVGEHDPERNVGAGDHSGQCAPQRPGQPAGSDTCAPGLA